MVRQGNGGLARLAYAGLLVAVGSFIDYVLRKLGYNLCVPASITQQVVQPDDPVAMALGKGKKR